MRDVMYQVPSLETVRQVIITGDVVNGKAEPEMLHDQADERQGA